MPHSSTHPQTEPEVYEAFQSGELSKEEAKEFFGRDWDEVRQLARVESILASQPDPDVADSHLFR